MKLEKSDLQLETIVTRINQGELDLQPDFQRGEIWDRKRRQRLIDTILREWYVPAIHIVLNSNNEELVLDGQQRLAAIRDFFDDSLQVDGYIEPSDERIEQLDGLKYSQLPPNVRKAVNRFVVPIITLSEYRPQEPNELFFRLNQAYNLTPPEKRNALHGPARDQVKGLVGELTDAGLLRVSRIGFSNGRLAYDDIIARTCVAIEVGTIRKHINNEVVERFYRTTPFSSSTIDGVRDSGIELLRQIEENGERVRFNKGTLQTWLVYCYWVRGVGRELPPTLLAEFETARALLKNSPSDVSDAQNTAVDQILKLYDDRASYRVTDVSSVLIRDLAVHLFSEMIFGSAPHLESDELIGRLRSKPNQAPSAIGRYLDLGNWGNLKLGAEESS